MSRRYGWARRGVTRPELLAVLAILAAMSVIAAPCAFVGPAKAELPSPETDRKILETAAELYWLENRNWPNDSAQLATQMLDYLPSHERRRIEQSFRPGSVFYSDDQSRRNPAGQSMTWCVNRERRTVIWNNNDANSPKRR